MHVSRRAKKGTHIVTQRIRIEPGTTEDSGHGTPALFSLCLHFCLIGIASVFPSSTTPPHVFCPSPMTDRLDHTTKSQTHATQMTGFEYLSSLRTLGALSLSCLQCNRPQRTEGPDDDLAESLCLVNYHFHPVGAFFLYRGPNISIVSHHTTTRHYGQFSQYFGNPKGDCLG